jgi:hypothetical protein
MPGPVPPVPGHQNRIVRGLLEGSLGGLRPGDQHGVVGLVAAVVAGVHQVIVVAVLDHPGAFDQALVALELLGREQHPVRGTNHVHAVRGQFLHQDRHPVRAPVHIELVAVDQDERIDGGEAAAQNDGRALVRERTRRFVSDGHADGRGARALGLGCVVEIVLAVPHEDVRGPEVAVGPVGGLAEDLAHHLPGGHVLRLQDRKELQVAAVGALGRVGVEVAVSSTDHAGVRGVVVVYGVGVGALPDGAGAAAGQQEQGEDENECATHGRDLLDAMNGSLKSSGVGRTCPASWRKRPQSEHAPNGRRP